MIYDSIVLGAGIVGTCTAVHLQMRGQRVCLIDKSAPGKGTSFGNAGLIERASVVPYAFPRDASRVFKYALNRQPDMRYDPKHLPSVAGWLLKFWANSSHRKLGEATRDMLPLIERCLEEHDALIEMGNLQSLIRERGWIEVYRTAESFVRAQCDAHDLRQYNLNYEILAAEDLMEVEPSIKSGVIGGIHWKDPKTVTDPEALTLGYSALFERLGGEFQQAAITWLGRSSEGWKVVAQGAEFSARNVVVCLGAQSAEILKPLGFEIPLAVKRGYHLHFEHGVDGHELNHSLCDSMGGYVLAPMKSGIRLTTGIEFASPSAAVNRTQLNRAEAIARTIYPLGKPVEHEPWLGLRPCLPDMRPVMGPSHLPGLWMNFGHAHHGLTLGPITGRLVAECVTGHDSAVDLMPYSIARFS